VGIGSAIRSEIAAACRTEDPKNPLRLKRISASPTGPHRSLLSERGWCACSPASPSQEAGAGLVPLGRARHGKAGHGEARQGSGKGGQRAALRFLEEETMRTEMEERENTRRSDLH
jgi:hypothetical protein